LDIFFGGPVAEPSSVTRAERRGKFLTFEGGEGAGKSTQVRLLAQALRGHGIKVITTREPGGSPEAENIRSLLVTGDPGRWDPISETLLLYAARRDHWVNLIEPALRDGKWVICDRFADSTRVYQGVGKGVDRDVLDTLHRLALGDVEPDLTIFLELPAETGLSRTRTRESISETQETRFERMDLAFHQSLRDGFAALAEANPHRIVALDAADEVAVVANAVLDVVQERLPWERQA
jgi:dTMP kinase